MPARDDLHQLIEEFPEAEIARVSRVLRALLPSAEEERLYTVDTAPEDDEPYTPEERAAVAAALRDVEEGRTVSHDEVKRSWGLG
jgi:predicted transcriptional regulator